MSQTYLITGASTGFRASSPHALAQKGHTVFAGMYSQNGDTKQHEDDIAKYSKDPHEVDLRPVPLDLLSQDSVDAAVNHIVSTKGRIDAVVRTMLAT